MKNRTLTLTKWNLSERTAGGLDLYLQNHGLNLNLVKDGLEEINVLSETNIGVARLTVTADKRYYTFPNDMTKLLSVRVKNHLNNKGEYRAIPRLIYQPRIVDSNEPRRGDK